MIPEEARDTVSKLSDEEVAELVSIYEDIKKYETALDEEAREADPEAYAQMEQEYQSKMAELDKKYAEDMEKLQGCCKKANPRYR